MSCSSSPVEDCGSSTEIFKQGLYLFKMILVCWKKSCTQVASYPFTTLQPHLGTISFPEGQITIADIPGIIAGAAENRGLGHNFLRHISRATALAYVVDISSDRELKEAQKRSWDQLAWLQVISAPSKIAPEASALLTSDQNREL